MKYNPFNPKNVDEEENNLEYESASFLFYILYGDRLITYWLDEFDVPKSNITFFSWECGGCHRNWIVMAPDFNLLFDC